MWNEIADENDLLTFMNTVDYFHDSCIKEIKYISGAYVSEDLSMYPLNEKRNLNIIVQRQFEINSVLEMEFQGLKFLKLFPVDVDYTCEILGATAILKDNCIYWCDCDGLNEKDLDQYDGTIICASKLRWRSVAHFIGKKEVYIHNEFERSYD